MRILRKEINDMDRFKNNGDKESVKITSIIGRSIEIPLRIFGIWPDAPYSVYCRILWTIAFVITQYFQYQYTIMHMNVTELLEFMEGLSASLAFTVLLIKLLTLWINQREKNIHACRTFKTILSMMAIDWKTNSGIDLNMMLNNATLSHTFSNYIFGFHSISVILFSISILILSISDKDIDISMRPFILRMNFPFRVDTELIYGVTIAIQFIFALLSTIIVGVINTLLVALVLHLASQTDILRRWLTEILFSEENGYKPNSMIINKIFKKHQNIIFFSENIENLYSYIALLLFVSDTLLICFIGVLFFMSLESSKNFLMLLKILPYYFIMHFEAFVYCFAGELVSVKSKMIGEAAYNSSWYQSTTQNSRLIVFLIMRSQHQLTITIGKFMELSLQQFTNIIKTSASYVSIMLAMY